MTDLTRKSGHQTLNGPILEGFSCLLHLPDGVEVMVTATTQEQAEGIADYLGEAAKSFHCLVGQPPWYMNQTKDHTLQDAVSQFQAAIWHQERRAEVQRRVAAQRQLKRR